mmetsp:Transcript_34298/g.80184  ORF Transcript_34298/g.80184 Transcript_34298/m.80184 type:complete len:1541 (+) Transcript_34298:74-4696(+)
MATAQAGGDPNFFVRRADPDDIDTVNELCSRKYPEEQQLNALATFHGLSAEEFRSTTRRAKFFVSLVETCFMSVTVEDDEGHIVGFAALDDSPVLPVANEYPGGWEAWLHEVYAMTKMDGMNTLWFSCCLVELEREAMAEILRTTFSTMPDLQHLLVMIPATVTEDDMRQLMEPFDFHFQELDVISDQHAVPGLSVLACTRSQIVRPLYIRMAKVEDHDNLVAVFNTQSEVITDIYGEYFIAELIEAQNEENKALVAEVEGRAVGMMCLTSNVDINVLSQCFYLDPYDNLLKPNIMTRVRDHARSMMEGGNIVRLCAQGDYLQAGLSFVDIASVLDSIPRHEDGRISAAELLQALKLHEFSGVVGEELQNFGEDVMTLLWQFGFLEPLPEVTSMIDPKRVEEAINTFIGLTLEDRKDICQLALDNFEQVQEIFNFIQVELSGADEGEEQEGEVKAALPPAPAAAGKAPGPGEEATEIQRDGAFSEAVAVEAIVFFKALTIEEEGPFSPDFLAKLLMTLHWWGNGVDLSTPVSAVPEDCLWEALQEVMQSDEGLFVGHPQSPMWLADLPPHAKDVFCVNMCCLDQQFQTQALDFLLPAFSLYPEKDYCIITQPHTAPNTPLLNAFTIIPPQPQNTFSHVLYLIHRAAIMGPPRVRELAEADFEMVGVLTQQFEDAAQQDIVAACRAAVAPPSTEEDAPKEASNRKVLVAEFDEQVVGLMVLEVPTPDIVETLRCCYHLDDYVLVEHHERHPQKGLVRLVHWVVNPLFYKFTRRLLQGSLRLTDRSVLFLEMDLLGVASPIFRELLQVAPRRPPIIKIMARQPPKVASFANVEKHIPTTDDILEENRQGLLRDTRQTKALSIVAKKLLSETKIPVNARIVVVGASDCGLSFLESLLSIPHLLFNSLTLLSPGGLEYHHSRHLPLIQSTAAYSHHELRRIMLELRVRMLDSRMVQIDRQQRCCILHDGSMLPYDYLIIAAGLQDSALHSMRIRSWGVEHVTEGYRRVNGAISVADPSIRDLLVEGGTLIKSLIWNPLSYVVVFGRSLHAYCVVQGLLLRKVPPTKIILVLPPRLEEDAQHGLAVDAFTPEDEVEQKIHHILKSMDIKVYDGYKLLGIQQDNRDRLKALVLEEYNSPAPEEPSMHSTMSSSKAMAAQESHGPKSVAKSLARSARGALEDMGTQSAKGLAQKLLACRILITADSHNVDPDVFASLHGNGLVYDGRLIVDHNFKTTDGAIFAAGSLCEFSRRFQRKNSTKYLRHDGFNGREVGAKLAQALLKVLDPVSGDMLAAGAPAGPPGNGPQAAVFQGGRGSNADVTTGNVFEGLEAEETSPELLPEFYMPIARGGLLPGNLHYYHITSCRRDSRSVPSDEREDRVIATDTLNMSDGTGHFCRLTIDGFGKVDSITYLGGEELQVESLWSLVGLSAAFLNHLYARWRDGDIPDIVEFLTDEWATALFHDNFMDFCHQIKLEMSAQEQVRQIINSALQGLDLQKGLSRQLLAEIREKLPPESIKQMQDHLIEYLRENTNHLKSYFLPENWVRT